MKPAIGRGKWAALAAAVVVCGAAYGQASKPIAMAPVWEKEVLELASSLPIQDGGRVKPLSTYAAFTLLKMNGARTLKVPDPRNLGADGQPKERRLTPIEWLLDCLFYPDAAERYRCFVVETYEVVDSIGVSHEGKKKRDRYSYAELRPGIDKLYQLARQYNTEAEGDTQKLSPVQGQIVNLATNVFEFQRILHYLDFARHTYPIAEGSAAAQLIPENRYSGILEKLSTIGVVAIVLDRGMETIEAGLGAERAQELRSMIPAGFGALSAEDRRKALSELNAIVQDASLMSGRATGLALFPPTKELGDQKEWIAAGELFEPLMGSSTHAHEQIQLIAELETLTALRDQPEAFKSQLAKFHDSVVGIATERGEYSKVPIEVSFYKWKFFFWAQWLFVLVFVLVAISWIAPAARSIDAAALWGLFVPTALLIIGITYRCIIRGRPPVSTLYETILFIAAVAVVCAIAIEFMNRQRIALSVGSVLGAMGMFLANRFEEQQGVDTMPELIAVLDTNFWLSTHVTTVTMGYSAGLLAAAIAHIYIIGRLIGFRKEDKAFYKNLSRMTYGVICFGLVFSTVGTVLGGIWANDSWGRFWGWDPKENGALMIVLWELAMLHARMGGYIRDLGFAVASTFGAIIVAFSWWGVNLLGVGLHSYGFTSGIMPILLGFYTLELAVCACGVLVWILERYRKPAPAVATAPPEIASVRKKRLPAKAAE
ncbi:MAG: hypothetical protein AMXMBFR4_02580 [Candidatus Hydrogenedentota bacterium]